MFKFSSILFTVLDPTYESCSIKLIIRYQFINLSPAWLSKTSKWSCWASNVLKAHLSNGPGSKTSSLLRTCLHGGGGPQVGEVTCLGGVTHLSLILIWSHLHDGCGDLPNVTSPIWCPTPLCEQALTESLDKTNNPRVFPYKSHNYRYASPQRVWFLSLLVCNWLWLSRELRECMDIVIVSIPNEYERKTNMWIRNAFEEIFCLRSKC